MSNLVTPEEIVARVPEWRGAEVTIGTLHGGLANRSYVATVDGRRYVLKAMTRAMDTFNLMNPVEDICRNTVAAGSSGVGAQVIHCFPDMPAMVLEFIDGVTVCTADLGLEANLPRLGRAIGRLHRTSPDFDNVVDIWTFLSDYLALVNQHALPTPAGLVDALPLIRTIQARLQERALPLVPSHNDLLPLNIMDDGEIRLIDYDFSGMNDPAFDLGDLAMEGKLDPEQLTRLCDSYFGNHDRTQIARARLFGIAAQYTWTLLFIGMHHVLPEAPDEKFDYLAEASSRWAWTAAQLDLPDMSATLTLAAGR